MSLANVNSCATCSLHRFIHGNDALLCPNLQLYKEFEEASYQKLMKMVDTKAGDLPKGIFTDFAAKIYKRDK